MKEVPKDPINYQIDWARFAELVNNAKNIQKNILHQRSLSPEERFTCIRDQLLQDYDNADELVRWMVEFKEADEVIERIRTKE